MTRQITHAIAILIVLLAIVCALITAHPAHARWTGEGSPELRAWFNSLKQPDIPGMPCCGEADVYYADDVAVIDGETIATITDNRGNPIAVGTQIKIPPNKLNRDPNITGHTIVFIGEFAGNHHVYCFIPSLGM